MPAAVEEKVRARFAGKSIASFTITTDDDNDPAVFAPILAEAAKADLVLLSFSVMRNRMGDPAPLGLVREFLVDLTSRCRAIALSHGNPFIVPALPGLAAGLSSWGEGGWFGNRFVTIDSMLRIVTGELAPAGTLPLAVGPLPIGHGLTWSV